MKMNKINKPVLLYYYIVKELQKNIEKLKNNEIDLVNENNRLKVYYIIYRN